MSHSQWAVISDIDMHTREARMMKSTMQYNDQWRLKLQTTVQ